jgi:Tol biopolymer transport system component
VYSPDGTRVAYLAAGSVAGASLVVAAASGSQARVVFPAGVGLGEPGLVWSPTGDRIAFTAGSYSEPNELRVVEVASGTVTKLATAPGTDSLQVIKFSPEGDRILFSRLDATAVGMSLWSVRADGSDAQLLVTGTGWGDWRWQPSGP